MMGRLIRVRESSSILWLQWGRNQFSLQQYKVNGGAIRVKNWVKRVAVDRVIIIDVNR